ncbi:hypothetical protein GUITHDRAFT_144696 [Guillardia theta CCMP2712]|uniref:glycerol kinase n=3 Tax=Guillardia theta TaxID=55529 RepID=L1IPR5_GUITC|nr:hypothetical protein GUITHDRAFT_144696 [Guillardia theta CCMP2712]EKX37874.1 hypothetical protein GUITHDRAFT_144696 [Guillardia theta CCMP2712]|eukprot:XP_005824854.1 hypothetical protein GUITHDRAFT_144696 [Guillardia theta CCMP2712]
MAPKRAASRSEEGGVSLKRVKDEEKNGRAEVAGTINERDLARLGEATALGAAKAATGGDRGSSNEIGSILSGQASAVADYTAAINLFSLNATGAHPFHKALAPHPFVQVGAVPPPNLPMPISTVPLGNGLKASISPEIRSMEEAAGGAYGGVLPSFKHLPSALSAQFSGSYGTAVLSLPHYLSNSNLTALTGIDKTLPAQSFPSNGLHSPAMAEAAKALKPSPSLSRMESKGDTSSNRSHGPSMDRYKNRWSDDEIQSLKKGVARFEKKNKKKGEDNSSDKGRGEQGKKGETEHMWEHILKSYKFQSCRTARDLKDKWRQLKKKEQDDMLGVREEARRLRMLAVGTGRSSASSSNTSQGNGHSGDNGSSTSSSNGHTANTERAENQLDSPGQTSSSPPAGMSSSGSTSSPAPVATSSSKGQQAESKERNSSPSSSSTSDPSKNSYIGGGVEEKCRSQEQSTTTNSSESGGVEGHSEGSGQGEVASSDMSGGGEGGSEGGEGGSDGVGCGSEETGGSAVGSSGIEGGSEGSGGAEGGSDGGSEWREDEYSAAMETGENEPEMEKTRRRKRATSCSGQEDRTIGWEESGDTDWALAIDMGSTCVRVSLVGKDGRLLAGVEGQRRVIMDLRSRTFSAEEYLAAAFAALDDTLLLLRKRNAIMSSSTGRQAEISLSPRAASPKVASISCFAMSLVGLGEGGTAVTPIYTYADARNSAFASELKRKLAEEGSLDFVERRTAPLQSCYAPALFMRLKQSGIDAVQPVKSWSTLSGYFLSQLIGKFQPVTFSEASWTGLLDREELQWHQGLLNLLGVSLSSLPPLCDADDLSFDPLLPSFAQRWPELSRVPWARGISEGAAASVGTGCESRAKLCIALGTNAALRVCIPCRDRRKPASKGSGGHKGGGRSEHWKLSKAGMKHKEEAEVAEVPRGLWCYSVKRDMQIAGGTLIDGGSIYAWGLEQFAGGLEGMARLQEEASAMDADSHGLTVLPFFNGGSSTGFRDGATGTVTGMTLKTSRADILRAIMESVALRLRGMFNAIRPLMNENGLEVYATGDALFKSPLWQQILADSFALPIRILSGATVAASRGAAILAWRSIGEEATVEQKAETTVMPVPSSVAALAMAFERQEALFNRLHRS